MYNQWRPERNDSKIGFLSVFEDVFNRVCFHEHVFQRVTCMLERIFKAQIFSHELVLLPKLKVQAYDQSLTL